MSRGGMSKNPFGGNQSMNSLDDDFMKALFTGELTVDQTFALRIIKMSVRDYLYFGLGKNGITPEKFLEAYQYLYKVRSDDPRTWGDSSLQKSGAGNVDISSQSIKNKIHNQEIPAKCFDVHYNSSGLISRMSFSGFLNRLKKKRESIVNANMEQVIAYMEEYKKWEWKTLQYKSKTLGVGNSINKGKHDFPRVNVVRTLTSPEDPTGLAKLYLFGRSAPNVKNKQTQSSIKNSLNYKKLLFEGVIL